MFYDGWIAMESRLMLTIGGVKGMDKVTIVVETEALDPEWVHLIKTARKMGFSLEEIRNFIKTATKQ